jgi:hypothetical protein
MRIRSILAGFAISAGALVLSAPGALADTQPTTPTSSRAPQTTTTTRPAPPSARPATPEARPVDQSGRPPQVVKPVGAAETGAGMEDASSNTGLLVGGGIGLVVLAGGGTVALRRMRKQS